MNLEQYKIVSARRLAANNLVWQTPTLASAAQAFLLSAALNPSGKGIFPMVLAIASTSVGLASIQLMTRHRHVEIVDAQLLRKFEMEHSAEGYSVVHWPSIPDCPPAERWIDRPRVWLANTRASRVWMFVLIGFVVLGLSATCRAAIRLMNEISN
jgi:hypothetical protein